jgi:plasmid maintenance system antidote protein VapI
MKGNSKNGRARRSRSPQPEPLPAALRRLLARARLTEEGLARLAGRSLRSINRLFCGHTDLSVDMACQIAGPLHTRAETLLILQARHAAWKHQRARGRQGHRSGDGNARNGPPPVVAQHEPPALRLVEPADRDGQRGTLTPTERAGSKTSPPGAHGAKGGSTAAGNSTSSKPPLPSATAAHGSASSTPRRRRFSHVADSDDSGSSRSASV